MEDVSPSMTLAVALLHCVIRKVLVLLWHPQLRYSSLCCGRYQFNHDTLTRHYTAIPLVLLYHLQCYTAYTAIPLMRFSCIVLFSEFCRKIKFPMILLVSALPKVLFREIYKRLLQSSKNIILDKKRMQNN